MTMAWNPQRRAESTTVSPSVGWNEFVVDADKELAAGGSSNDWSVVDLTDGTELYAQFSGVNGVAAPSLIGADDIIVADGRYEMQTGTNVWTFGTTVFAGAFDATNNVYGGIDSNYEFVRIDPANGGVLTTTQPGGTLDELFPARNQNAMTNSIIAFEAEDSSDPNTSGYAFFDTTTGNYVGEWITPSGVFQRSITCDESYFYIVGQDDTDDTVYFYKVDTSATQVQAQSYSGESPTNGDWESFSHVSFGSNFLHIGLTDNDATQADSEVSLVVAKDLTKQYSFQHTGDSGMYHGGFPLADDTVLGASDNRPVFDQPEIATTMSASGLEATTQLSDVDSFLSGSGPNLCTDSNRLIVYSASDDLLEFRDYATNPQYSWEDATAGGPLEYGTRMVRSNGVF